MMIDYPFYLQTLSSPLSKQNYMKLINNNELIKSSYETLNVYSPLKNLLTSIY